METKLPALAQTEHKDPVIMNLWTGWCNAQNSWQQESCTETPSRQPVPNTATAPPYRHKQLWIHACYLENPPAFPPTWLSIYLVFWHDHYAKQLDLNSCNEEIIQGYKMKVKEKENKEPTSLALRPGIQPSNETPGAKGIWDGQRWVPAPPSPPSAAPSGLPAAPPCTWIYPTAPGLPLHTQLPFPSCSALPRNLSHLFLGTQEAVHNWCTQLDEFAVKCIPMKLSA